jgi:serine/threonine-protein kinase
MSDEFPFLTPGGALRGALAEELFAHLGRVRELGVGERVGPWKICNEIGRGGMAIVYLAERADGEFEQTVALKWLRPEGDALAAQSLFRRERQILAALEHPHIARLLDGGHTEDGMLWFVLEHVAGERIDRYCQQQALPLERRLRLFVQTCEAVQFAHSHALIHRDIKPANVLVTEAGSAKLLDFGIAQLSGSDDVSLAAHAHTPGFASPEQRSGHALSTASDIYQLGHLLECVLAPEQSRATDLIAIKAHAMADDPSARYATVAELIDDIGRFVHGRPVRARAGGIAYRLQRFVGRNALQVGAGVVAASLFLGLLVWFLARLETERDTAQREAARANASLVFLTDLFKVSDPAVDRGDSLTANQILEAGTSRMNGALGDQPSVRAALLHTIGVVHMNLGQHVRAEPLLRESLAISRDHADIPAADVAGRWRALAQVQWRLGRYEDARVSARTGYALIENDATQAELAGKLLNTVAICEFLLGRFEDAVSIERKAIALVEAQLGPQHELAGFAYNNLARALSELDRQGEALEALDKAVANVAARLGEDDPDTHMVKLSYARQLARLGRHGEAALILAKAEEGVRRRLGEHDTRYAYALLSDAQAHLWAGDAEESRLRATAARDILRANSGADPSALANTSDVLGQSMAALGRHDDALAQYREALEIRQRHLRADHVDVASSHFLLGGELCRRGESAAGRGELEQALAIRVAALPAAHGAIAATRLALADCVER